MACSCRKSTICASTRSAARRSAISRSRNKMPFLKEILDRPPCLFRNVNFAFMHPIDEIVWGNIDELDLVGPIEDVVGHGFANLHLRDLAITSFKLSKCCTFSVVYTLMPALSRSSTSCHRLECVMPGALVWASSSTRITCGLRPSAASRSNS